MKYTSRILVVDDEPEMLSACTKILKAFGHKPFPVQSGDLAIQLLQEEEFDLVLCDLLMPVVDGIQVLQAVQKYIPDIPVIIFTAYGTIDRAVSVMKEGAFDFIEKPSGSISLDINAVKGRLVKQIRAATKNKSSISYERKRTFTNKNNLYLENYYENKNNKIGRGSGNNYCRAYWNKFLSRFRYIGCFWPGTRILPDL